MAVKNERVQAVAMAFSTREPPIRQRMQAIKYLRGHLGKFRHVVPQGAAKASLASVSRVGQGSFDGVVGTSNFARYRHFATVLRDNPLFWTNLRELSLRLLSCCSSDLCGRGAPWTNVTNTASFHSCKRLASSNRGVKHLDMMKVARL
jgi:hypothetical protein